MSEKPDRIVGKIRCNGILLYIDNTCGCICIPNKKGISRVIHYHNSTLDKICDAVCIKFGIQNFTPLDI